MNHYQTLGVPPNATQAEIKSAFRKKVKKVHPDINPGKSDQEFIKLNEAYEVISNASTRSLYDLYLQGVPVKTDLTTSSSQDRYRENYKRKRARTERERVASQVVYKQKFYRKLRFVNAICLLISLIFTFDYHTTPREYTFVPSSVEYERLETIIYLKNGNRIKTSDGFYGQHSLADSEEITLYSSGLLSIPMRLSKKDVNKRFLVKGNIYVFGNGIGFLMFLFSVIVVGNKNYTDPRLTCGVFAVLMLIWAMGITLVYS